MAVSELTSVLPPPRILVEPGTPQQWDHVQKKLGIRLPQDLYDLAMKYGSGRIYRGLIECFNPFAPSYVKTITSECTSLQKLADALENQPYAFFPKEHGLFPCGWDESGGRFLWLTEGRPDKWPIILLDDENRYERWDMSLTTFLARALTNEIACLLWDRFARVALEFAPQAQG